MELVFVDLWNIVDKYEGAPSSNVDPKVKKKYQKRIKKAMSIIAFNLADNKHQHTRNRKWRYGRSFVISMRQEVCPIFYFFTASFPHAQCKTM
jgi:hypothetical protein